MIYIIIICILILYIIFLLYKKNYIIEKFKINGVESYKYLRNTLDDNNKEKYNDNYELISLKNKLKLLKEHAINMTACCNNYSEKAICSDLKEKDICIKPKNNELPKEINSSIKINKILYDNSLKNYEKEYKDFMEENKKYLKDCEYNLRECISDNDIECNKFNLIKEEDCYKYDYMKVEECKKDFILPEECINKGYMNSKDCKINKPEKIEDYDKYCPSNGFMKTNNCLKFSNIESNNSYVKLE